jgi:ribosomal protein S18 acetylase RimI-like enzyme
MNLDIRHGAPSDADALAEIAARTFRDTFTANTHPDDMKTYVAAAYGPAQQRRELADPDISTLLVHAGEKLAGYAQLRRSKAPACVTGKVPIELWRFYVSREWHGRGIAQRLMQAAEIDADRGGALTLWLGVWEQNERAKAFYRKCGFADVGSHIFMVGSDPQTDRIMTKSLIQACARR